MLDPGDQLYAFKIQALGRIQTYKHHRVKTLTVIIEKFDCSQNGSFRLVALFTIRMMIMII